MNPVSAQYTLGVDGGYTIGFNSKTVYVAGKPVSQQMHQGFQLNVANGFRFSASPFEITTRLGVKYLTSNGEYRTIRYWTETYKVLVGFGGMYHFNSKIKVGSLIRMENNLDFDKFISQTSDLFRFSFQAEVFYPILKRLDTYLQYSVALTPLSHHYLITNPQHQFALGITYRIL